MVVLAYNLPGLSGAAEARPGRLRRTSSRARSGRWNDPRIRARQPGPEPPEPQHRAGRAAGQQRHDVRVHQSSERDQRGVARSGAGGRQPASTGPATPCWPAATRAWPGVSRSARVRSAMSSTISPSGSACRWPSSRTRPGASSRPSEHSGQAALAANVKQMPSNLRLFLPDPEGEDVLSDRDLQLAAPL